MKEMANIYSLGYDELAQLAKVHSHSRALALFFHEEYEKQTKHDISEQLTYLELKYFHKDSKWEYLNGLAKIYISLNKNSFAYLCLIESLRLNPDQADIFHLAESLRKYARPKFPQELKRDRYPVSVVMTTYNRVNEIKAAIRSVLDQTFQDFELIIINDAGLVEMKDIVEAFHSPKIKYVRLDKNVGYSEVQNQGILRAEGKYIAYLDDDDIYYPTHLETLVRALNKGKYKVAYTNTYAVNGKIENKVFKFHSQRFLWDKEFNKAELALKNYIAPLAIMHRKDIVNKIGLFNQECFPAGDWETYVRSALEYDFLHIDMITGEYRNRDDNTTLRNLAKLRFNQALITNYYIYHQGNIAYIKYHLQHGQREIAQNLYDKLRENYNNSLQTRFAIEELIEIARFFNDGVFQRQLASSYLYVSPRIYLRKAVKDMPRSMSLRILPLVPAIIFKKTMVKGMQFFKKCINKTRNIRQWSYFRKRGIVK